MLLIFINNQNKAKALKVIRAKVYELEREKTQSARRDSRNKQIGTGDRSEKIRTYNFPQVNKYTSMLCISSVYF